MIFNQLVEDIREESCLWSLKSKPKLEDQEDAWRRVAGKNKMTSVEVKLIFRELSKKYKEERKKPKSTWKLLQALRFLDEDIEPQTNKFKPPSATQLLQQPKSSQSPLIARPQQTPAQINEEFNPDAVKIKDEPIDEIINSQNTSEEDVYVELLEVGDDSDTDNDDIKNSHEFSDEEKQENQLEKETSKDSERGKLIKEFGKEKENQNDRKGDYDMHKETEREQGIKKDKEKEKTMQTEKEKISPGRQISQSNQNKNISILKPATMNSSLLKSTSTGSNSNPNAAGSLSLLSSRNSPVEVKKIPLIFSGLKRKLANGIDCKTNGVDPSQPPEKQSNISQEKNRKIQSPNLKRMSSTPPLPTSPLYNTISESRVKPIVSEKPQQSQPINISNDIEMVSTMSRMDNNIINIGDVIPMPEVQSIKIEPADDNFLPIEKPIPIINHSRTYDSFGQYVSNTLSTLPVKLANKLEIKILEAILAINTEKMNIT